MITTLGELLDTIPEEMKSHPQRAFALVTVGEHGDVGIAILGMTQEQWRDEILPILIEDEVPIKH